MIMTMKQLVLFWNKFFGLHPLSVIADQFIISDKPLVKISAYLEYTFGYLNVTENRSGEDSRTTSLPIY